MSAAAEVAPSSREFDLVLYGATGFTGALCAAYLAREARLPASRWALAGRNRDKLARVRDQLAAIDPSYGSLALLEASAERPSSLVDAASRSRALLTTVGPYALHGEPCVAACVEARTHYADITGEPQFVGRMIERYDAAARDRNVRLVPCCGFDSVPHDLGAYFAAKQLAHPLEGALTIEGFVRSRGSFSGGTWQSALGAFANPRAVQRESKALRKDPGPGRRVRLLPQRIRFEPAIGAWACPLPTIDPQIVLRSAASLPQVYGDDFLYGHYARVKSAVTLGVGLAGVAGLVGLTQIPPAKKLLERVRASGEGPDEATRARNWFEVLFLARSSGRQVMARVAGGDPGYSETAKMLAEAGLCLALDEAKLAPNAGVLTTATAMGDALLERLQRAGMRFERVAG